LHTGNKIWANPNKNLKSYYWQVIKLEDKYMYISRYQSTMIAQSKHEEFLRVAEQNRMVKIAREVRNNAKRVEKTDHAKHNQHGINLGR
jgi:hypothetical protein